MNRPIPIHSSIRGEPMRKPECFSKLSGVVACLIICSSLGTAAVGAEEGIQVLRGSLTTNGRIFRKAFEEVVVQARQATVRFLKQGKTLGLGTIVESDGGILAKASQINGADEVELSDGRKFPFRIVGAHSPLDLALVHIEAETPQVVKWTAETPTVGHWFVTVGLDAQPLGVGVMSVPRRSIPRTDAHGYLGVRLDEDQSPVIRQVYPNTAAADAGLQEGDRVIEVDRKPVLSGSDLQGVLRTFRPGDSVTIKAQRNEQELDFLVTLRHPFGELLSRIAMQNQMGGGLSLRRDDFQAVYQHDTVLAPEDCGGPVVDLSGHAVGINIARAGRTESYVLPFDLIESVLPLLKNTASSPTPADAGEPVSTNGSPSGN